MLRLAVTIAEQVPLLDKERPEKVTVIVLIEQSLPFGVRVFLFLHFQHVDF